MSLLPLLVESGLLPLARPRRRSRLLDQHFGLSLSPEDTLTAVAAPLSLITQDYIRPWRQLATAADDLGSTLKTDKDKVQLHLDVQQFSPEEISVKTADGYVIVEGKHEEKEDEHGFVSRRFVRRYALPEDCPAEKVESKLSSDGVLTVVAPRKRLAIERQRDVEIERTGPVKKKAKRDNAQQQNGDKMEQ